MTIPSSLRQVDLRVAALDFLGQGPILLTGTAKSTDRHIDFLKITKPFGRFGNNYYQAMHAAVLAQSLNIPRIVMPAFEGAEPVALGAELGFSVGLDPDEEMPGCGLEGTFYAPYGFERLFTDRSPADLSVTLRKTTDQLYPKFNKGCAQAANTLAVHIRAGDIFAAGSQANWYVQPPASFYIQAIEHAVTHYHFDHCDVIFEDRGNPAVDLVEAYLRGTTLSFRCEPGSIQTDMARLASADGLIFSFSSFVEAAALISTSVRTVYSFRTVSSQIDFAPFLQMRLTGIFLERAIDLYVIEDMSVCYIAPKTWKNSDDQRALIANYPASQLRIFALTKNCV